MKPYVVEFNYQGHQFNMFEYDAVFKGGDYIVLESMNSKIYKVIHILRVGSRDPIFRKSDIQFKVGRSKNCDLRIFDNFISNEHSIITLSDGDFYLSSKSISISHKFSFSIVTNF